MGGRVILKREIELKSVDWICLAQNRVQWRALVNVLMNLWLHEMLQVSLLSELLLAS
jgi:hypothetical protein